MPCKFGPIMIRSVLTILFLSVVLSSLGQTLAQVTFAGGANLSHFGFLTEQGVLIRVSPEGKILEWGNEVASERFGDYYSPKLQPFMGRVDYYGQESDSAFRGLIRSIGTCNITYYGTWEVESKRGKIRSIGSLILDYYDEFGNSLIRGKLRFIGSQIIEWFASYDEESVRGKLKSIANMPVTY